MSELRLPWHAGRTTGRALYDGDGPDDLIGVMDTRELAAVVVVAVNATNAALRGAEGQESVSGVQTPSGDLESSAMSEPMLRADQVAEMEQWLANLHQGTNVAPLDWFAALVASHAALTARLAEAEAERAGYLAALTQIANDCPIMNVVIDGEDSPCVGCQEAVETALRAIHPHLRKEPTDGG